MDRRVSVDIKNAFSSVAVETVLVTAGGNMKLALGFFRQMQCYSTPISRAYPPAARTTPYGSEDGKTGRHARVWNVTDFLLRSPSQSDRRGNAQG
jgi:hypothetical protein